MSWMWCHRTMAKVSLPAVILLTVFNIIMIGRFHERDTTIIYREIINRQSDGTSNPESPPNATERGRGQLEFIKRPDQEFKAPGEYKEWAIQEVATRPKTKDEELFPDIIMQDDDIDEMIKELNDSKLHRREFPLNYWKMSLYNLTHELGRIARQKAKTLSGYETKSKTNESLPNWKKFHRNIRQFSLYDPEDPTIDALLHDLANLPIMEAEENYMGSQFKLTLHLSDGGRAKVKVMRYEREVECSPNIYVGDDLERHIAEIAGFQLDRILGFYRVPPTVGRLISMADLRELAPENLKRTFFTSPAGNTCLFGHCLDFCEPIHAFCGNPDMIEVSMMAYLPSRDIAPRDAWYQPWKRTYSIWRKADWELDPEFCASIRDTSPFNNGKLLLDIIDSHTFDFLTGNKDRHSVATFKEFGNFSFPISYDNGRGFGRTSYDAMSILAPLRQCCVIRKSTFFKYVKLYTGPERLSVLMERALAPDPVAPVLIRGHLTALDRRVLKILKEVAICLKTHPPRHVIVNDEF